MRQIPGLPGYQIHDDRLKILGSLNRSSSDNFGVIIYTVLGKHCVFTQITRENNSSINLAEHIITAIAESEGLDVRDLEFFDLQTHLGYRQPEFDYHWRVGDFQYQRLELQDDQVEVVRWKNFTCPEEIVELFSPFIGPEPRQYAAPLQPWKPA